MAKSRLPAPHADHSHFNASPIQLASIASLVAAIRPEWQTAVVMSVLQSHAHHVYMCDLAVAATERPGADDDHPFVEASK